jgi:hypothetical protein
MVIVTEMRHICNRAAEISAKKFRTHNSRHTAQTTDEQIQKGITIMIEQDTVRLLRECDAGVKMGTASISDVLDFVRSEEMRAHLVHSKEEHNSLEGEIEAALHRFHDEGKEPNPIAKSMSHMKTTFKLGLEETDATVAELMTDGCNMGVKSLNQYLNQYKAASERSKDITKRLINLEEKLTEDIRGFL